METQFRCRVQSLPVLSIHLRGISTIEFLGTSWKQLNVQSCVYVLLLNFFVFINFRVVLGKDLVPWVRKPFPSFHWKSSHVPMLILTWNDCPFWYDCLLSLYLFCFAGCRGGGEFFCSVKTVHYCQFVNLLLILSEKLTMMLLHQQFLQAQNTDKNCKTLVGNETLGCYSIILEKGVAIILQTNMVWRRPFAKLAKTVNSVKA